MVKAKVFKSGNSQAIRLPKEFRLEVDSVKINRICNLSVIIPDDNPWENFIAGIKESEDFPEIEDTVNLREISL